MAHVHGPEIHVTTWCEDDGRGDWYARAEIVVDGTRGPPVAARRVAAASSKQLRVAVRDATQQLCGLHLTDPRYRRSNVRGLAAPASTTETK
jgi:hypothetical protein